MVSLLTHFSELWECGDDTRTHEAQYLSTHSELWRFVHRTRDIETEREREKATIHTFIKCYCLALLCVRLRGDCGGARTQHREIEISNGSEQQQCGTEAIDLYTFRLQSPGRSLNLWIFFLIIQQWLRRQWQMIETVHWLSVTVSENWTRYCLFVTYLVVVFFLLLHHHPLFSIICVRVGSSVRHTEQGSYRFHLTFQIDRRPPSRPAIFPAFSFCVCSSSFFYQFSTSHQNRLFIRFCVRVNANDRRKRRKQQENTNRHNRSSIWDVDKFCNLRTKYITHKYTHTDSHKTQRRDKWEWARACDSKYSDTFHP